MSSLCCFEKTKEGIMVARTLGLELEFLRGVSDGSRVPDNIVRVFSRLLVRFALRLPRA